MSSTKVKSTLDEPGKKCSSGSPFLGAVLPVVMCTSGRVALISIKHTTAAASTGAAFASLQQDLRTLGEGGYRADAALSCHLFSVLELLARRLCIDLALRVDIEGLTMISALDSLNSASLCVATDQALTRGTGAFTTSQKPQTQTPEQVSHLPKCTT
jgi:hypothetical protein